MGKALWENRTVTIVSLVLPSTTTSPMWIFLTVSSSSYPFSDPPVQSPTSSCPRETACSWSAASSCRRPAGTAASAAFCAASGSAPSSSARSGFCGRRASASAARQPSEGWGSGGWGLSGHDHHRDPDLEDSWDRKGNLAERNKTLNLRGFKLFLLFVK